MTFLAFSVASALIFGAFGVLAWIADRGES